jgi:hypothetical protein
VYIFSLCNRPYPLFVAVFHDSLGQNSSTWPASCSNRVVLSSETGITVNLLVAYCNEGVVTWQIVYDRFSNLNLRFTIYYKDLKIKIHKTLSIPIMLCECETYFLMLKEEYRFKVFANVVLRSLFGSTRDKVT